MENHQALQTVAVVNGVEFVAIAKSAKYPNKLYLFAGVRNGKDQFVPLMECLKYRQNAWNSNELQAVSESELERWAEVALNRGNTLIMLGKSDVDAVFSLRYRQKMTRERKSAMIARVYAVESLAIKSMTIADFASNIVHLAIHGGAPKTVALESDTWKIVRIYRGLCSL
jgi:hypothetical protein